MKKYKFSLHVQFHGCNQQRRTPQHHWPKRFHQKTHQVLYNIYGCGLHLLYKSNLRLASISLYMNVTHPGWLLKQYNLQFPSTATGGCACRALKMPDLRQLVNLKFGIGPFKEGPLHCVPTYLTTLRAKVRRIKQNSK